MATTRQDPSPEAAQETTEEPLYEHVDFHMGPQHPSTHGVLHVELTVDGETVVDCRPSIGFLHTGMEKLAESKLYYQVTPITDRMDYLSPMTNNMAWCLSVEKLLGIEVPPRAQIVRVLLAELSRLNSHLIWTGTNGLDIGALSMVMYGFRERDMILEMFDEVAGQRMNPSYMTPGGIWCDINEDTFIPKVRDFLKVFPSRLADYHRLLTKNPIWRARMKGVGILDAEQCERYSVTGPMLRAAGVDYDVRKKEPYSSYEQFEFDVPVRDGCDCYDRYLNRMDEMAESVRICKQAVDNMPSGRWITEDRRVALPPRDTLHRDMHALIHHFWIISNGYCPPKGQAYVPTESPKGEIGFLVVSDGTNKPLRMRVRPPSLINLQVLPEMVKGRLIADVVACIASTDIVLGEVDR